MLRFKAEIYQQNSTDAGSVLVMEWWMGGSANRKLALELLGCAAKLKMLSGKSLLGAKPYRTKLFTCLWKLKIH